MYYIFHRLTQVLVAKTTNVAILNEYNNVQYEVVIY
jgi:hypothetical protein